MFSDQNFVYISHVSRVCYIPHPLDPRSSDDPKNMLSPPPSHYLLPLMSKCSPQHPVLRHPPLV
jgi:hypothetical protein